MRRLILLLVFLLPACRPDAASPTPSAPSVSPTAPASRTPEPTPSLTPTPTPPPPGPYEQYTIDFLRGQVYGAGNIEVLEPMEETDAFTRYLIRYPSDGLDIYGFVNLPKGDGPFPVIVMIHGYVDPATYETLDYTTPAADGLTRAGYIVFHPNLRGYAPSGSGDNLFRVGMAVDVLNLLALIESRAGPPGLFASTAPDRIGLWGHSLGGNIALRVLTVFPDIKATVLYASMSGDELKNAAWLLNATGDPVFRTELSVDPALVARISPLSYYGDIGSPVQLHHGTADLSIPVQWAEETCQALTAAAVLVECLYYPEEDHTFRSRVMDQFGGNVMRFYEAYLSR